jgi:hypothetical protein
MSSVSVSNMAAVAVVSAFCLWKFVGPMRVGHRRSPQSTILHHDEKNVLVEERETGLLQQWYTDQPCQQLYALVFGAELSQSGWALIHDEDHVRQCVLALIQRHPSLTTTITRDPKSGRASLRNTRTSMMMKKDEHPLGRVPVKWYPRRNDGSWRDVAHSLTHTDFDESSWLFRVGIVSANGNKDAGDDHSHRVDIVMAQHHLLTDGKKMVALCFVVVLLTAWESFVLFRYLCWLCCCCCVPTHHS